MRDAFGFERDCKCKCWKIYANLICDSSPSLHSQSILPLLFAHSSFARFVVFQLFYMFIIRCSLDVLVHTSDLLFHRMKTKAAWNHFLFILLIDLMCLSVAVRCIIVTTATKIEFSYRQQFGRRHVPRSIQSAHFGIVHRSHNQIIIFQHFSRDHNGPQAMVGLARVFYIIIHSHSICLTVDRSPLTGLNLFIINFYAFNKSSRKSDTLSR